MRTKLKYIFDNKTIVFVCFKSLAVIIKFVCLAKNARCNLNFNVPWVYFTFTVHTMTAVISNHVKRSFT